MQPFNEKKPPSLSSQILRALAKVSSERDLQGDALAQAVVNLSRLFTTARATLPPRYLNDPAHASAYLSYFLPVNLSKVELIWTSCLRPAAWKRPIVQWPYLTLAVAQGLGP